MIKIILIQVLIICFSIQSISQVNEWKLSSTKDHISAHTRKVKDSKYLEYKIEAQITTSIEKAFQLISDTKNYKQIFPYLSKVELLNEFSEGFDVLVVIDTPFPAKDRIGVYTNQIEKKTEDELKITISQNNSLIPESKYVNIEACYGSWHLEKVDDHNISIIHTFFADPGGSIPPWLVNAFALKQPRKTFSIIRKLLESKN